MTLQEIQYKAQGIIHKWRYDDSAPYIEFVEELAHMIVPEPSEDLEEAAIQAAQSDMQDRQIMEASNDERMRYSRIFRRGFKAGVKWDREQMMKEAVEVTVEDWNTEPHPEITIPLNPEEYSNGDKVRIIVCKKEDLK